MEPGLTLIKNQVTEYERRVLPKFPYCYLTFKCTSRECAHVFEVYEISNSGMQLALKDGVHKFSADEKVEGLIHWHGSELKVQGTCIWTRPLRLGIKFSDDRALKAAVGRFFSIAAVAKNMRALHQTEIDRPEDLKFWVRTDGPTEIFAWSHKDGEYAKIQVLFLDDFVEWVDGQGVKTGKVVTKRDIDTPLFPEDEFVFLMDTEIDDERQERVYSLFEHLDESKVSAEFIDFAKLKLASK